MKDGASVGSADFAGATPLHMAAVFDQAEAVEALLKAGAPVNLADK